MIPKICFRTLLLEEPSFSGKAYIFEFMLKHMSKFPKHVLNLLKLQSLDDTTVSCYKILKSNETSDFPGKDSEIRPHKNTGLRLGGGSVGKSLLKNVFYKPKGQSLDFQQPCKLQASMLTHWYYRKWGNLWQAS